ncbi:HD domain-containing protein [Candidatus Saccharibacteria bacterium]|nr:HD domain-containing protein [Candidatus Saccharibacteria bacterium]
MFRIMLRITGTTSMNTSSERVDSLMQLSNEIYPAIDQRLGGETRARRILRLGINVVANELKHGDMHTAGEQYESILIDQLQRGGIHPGSYRQWPAYMSHIKNIPSSPDVQTMSMNGLANTYADVKRRTLAEDGKRERNARHAVHLSALALPYAYEQYPWLDAPRVAVYSLFHDVLEAYTGDVPTLGISEHDLALKYKAEEKAMEQLAFDYGQVYPEFVQAVHDYETLANPEARYTKTSDKLDPAYTHFANKGKQLVGFYGYTSPEQLLVASEPTTARIMGYGSEFPELLEDRLELLKRVADHTEWPATIVSSS